MQRTRLTGLEQHYLINIDHHATARPFGDVNWIDPDACATAEMIFRLAREAGVKISPEVATCLYTAVLTDTGSFCFHGTTERTFALAQELVRCARIRCGLRTTFTLTAAFEDAAAGRRVEWVATRRLAGVDARRSRHHGALPGQRRRLRRTGQLRLAIEGIEVALFFREQADGRFRVSLRSKGLVDVAAVAEGMGGGGHTCASGCAVDGPLTAAVERPWRNCARAVTTPACNKPAPALCNNREV